MTKRECPRCHVHRLPSRFAKGSDTCMTCNMFGQYRSDVNGDAKLATRCTRCFTVIKFGVNRTGVGKQCAACSDIHRWGGRSTNALRKWV